METNLFDDKILNAFYKIIDYLPQLMDESVTIAIADHEKFVFIRDVPEFPMKEAEGQPLTPDIKSLIYKGDLFVGEYSEDGSDPFKSYTMPIKDDNGNVKGAILLALPLKRKNEMMQVSETFKDSLGQISDAINDLNINIQEVVDANEKIMSIVKEADSKTADTNEILEFIQGISSQTNLLGLNAAIEASRAGEFGRGFDVVAKEIRKLSTSTSESIRKVDNVLKNVSGSIKDINNKVSDSNTVFETQASSLEEIAASVEELNATAQIMYSFAEKM